MNNIKTAALFLFIALGISNLYSQQWQHIITKDSLQSGDTIFLVNERIIEWNDQGDTSVLRFAVYIEPNKSLEYYDRIGDFGFGKYYDYYVITDADSNYIVINNRFYDYNYTYEDEDDFKEVFITLKKKKISKTLPTKWIPLYSYNNEYYLYAPCEWIIPKYNITDTLLMYYGWMDGIYGFSYDTIVQKSDEHYVIQGIKGFHNTEINIHIIDKKKGIAVFKFDDYKPHLYVDAEKIKNFPLIVCDCNEKYKEYEFPDIDLKKLIRDNKKINH